MKSTQLIQRKERLNEELSTVGQEIVKVGKAIEEDGLKSSSALVKWASPLICHWRSSRDAISIWAIWQKV